jgi:hypothetical protein
MNETLQRLFLVVFVIPILFSGCVTTSKSYKIVDDRIEFPNHKLSLLRLPNDWYITTDKTNELARWKQKVTRSSIAINPSTKPSNYSRSHWAKWVIEWTKNRMEKYSEKCDALNAKEEVISFDNKEFYQVSALIRCANFTGYDEGVYVDKKLYDKKISYAVLITQEKLYYFTLGATPEFYNQGEAVLYDLFESFTFLKE